MSVKLHPRTMSVQKARVDAKLGFYEIVQKYRLTYAEQMHVLGEIITDSMRYALRAERHPNDPDKGADEA